MAMTIVELTKIFHRAILERFRGSRPAGPDVPFLAFELGTPIPDETFHVPLDNPEYSPAVALEYLSHHANVAPKIRGGMFGHTGNTVDGQYEILLFGATAADPSSFDLFARVRNAAGAAFDETLGSSIPPGIGRFHPVHANPVNWYDQSVSDNWTTLRIEGFDTGGSGGVPPAGEEPRLDPALFKWRIAAEGVRPLLDTPLSVRAVQQAQFAAAKETGLGVSRVRRDICEVFDPRNTEKLFDCPVVPDEPPPPPVEKPVSSDGFSLRADVCLVHLRRPWLSMGLLGLTNWFVPSVARGAFSGGKGADDAGSFAALPIACVFVRNLAIKARWSTEDLNHTMNSSHLGTFSLMGRSFDQQSASLLVPGMQGVAWLCDPLPVLPPIDAP